MNFTLSMILVGIFAILLATLGIEFALVYATLASGLIWFGYWLIKGRHQDKKEKLPYIVENARSFFPILLFVLVLRSFLVEPFRIPSGSMMPTLLIGDFILVNKYTYGLRMPITKHKFIEFNEPQRGDVIVFRYPVNPKIDYIKRLVGLPGDTIDYRNKILYVNGQAMPQQPLGSYQAVGSGLRMEGAWEAIEDLTGVKHHILIDPMVPDFPPGCNVLANGPIKVPEGHYFVMGDNRDNSNDSRCWGLVPEKNLVGKAFMIWFNLDWKLSGLVDWSRIGTMIK